MTITPYDNGYIYLEEDYFNKIPQKFMDISDIIEHSLDFDPTRGASKLHRRRLCDVGCARGEFIHYLCSRGYASAFILEGVDFNSDLISSAQRKLAEWAPNINAQNISFSTDDLLRWCPKEKKDIITAIGVLSCFEDPYPIMERLSLNINEGGRLIGLTRLNFLDADVRLFYRNNVKGKNWQSSSAPSINTFRTVAESTGFVIEHLRRFEPKYASLEPGVPVAFNEIPLDPVRSYVVNHPVTSSDGVPQLTLMNGLGQIYDLYLFDLRKS